MNAPMLSNATKAVVTTQFLILWALLKLKIYIRFSPNVNRDKTSQNIKYWRYAFRQNHPTCMFVSAAPPQLIVLPSIHGRRGDSTMTPPPPTANKNQLMHSNRKTTMVGWGKGRWQLKRCGGWKSNNGVATNKQIQLVAEGWQGSNNYDNKQQSSIVQQQRRRSVAAGKRGRAHWWRWRSDCRAATKEKQLCNKVKEDGGGPTNIIPNSPT